MIPILLVAWALASAGAPVQTKTPIPALNPALVRVFVQTEDVGQGSELAVRRQSVKDLAAAMARKKKTIAVVADERGADIVLEILDRDVIVPKVVVGISPRSSEPLGLAPPVRIVVLRVKLTAGDAALEFTNKNKPADFAPGWKSAADDIGDQVEKWIAEHRAEILRRRGNDAN